MGQTKEIVAASQGVSPIDPEQVQTSDSQDILPLHASATNIMSKDPQGLKGAPSTHKKGIQENLRNGGEEHP